MCWDGTVCKWAVAGTWIGAGNYQEVGWEGCVCGWCSSWDGLAWPRRSCLQWTRGALVQVCLSTAATAASPRSLQGCLLEAGALACGSALRCLPPMFACSWTHNTHNNDAYLAYNKPGALINWLEKAGPLLRAGCPCHLL